MYAFFVIIDKYLKSSLLNNKNMLSPNSVVLLVGLVFLLVASLFDIKTREVPDWLNYALIAFSIGAAIILSVYHNYYHILLNAILGLGVGLVLGLLMFYTGQWGGGDAKLIMGLSSLIGFSFSTISQSASYFIIFVINLLLVGAIYGLGFSFVKALMNYKAFKEAIEKKLRTRLLIIARIVLLVLTIGAFIFFLSTRSVESGMIFGLMMALFFLFYLWMFISTVEKVCMVKKINVSKLTEGDWIVGDVVKNKKILLKHEKTGVNLEDIAMLKKKKIKEVIIKIGVPFVPSFLIAYIITFAVGNWLLFLV